ncbi:metal ABC transporter solute-binding protein, Zn/Mn family [Maridesulfovibrio salexigens]|uniref:Periplasmic solute binding protein n=1 Tax=Maridesulfovibrio salexigens (strain ATCC 14822 / DSM 2638 / NCIMB 8403 / VKM B-1763) TaxID=526222 RepID=C6C0C5_MARSD|nr:zinc ABC transporter substrate-binding protein [Maridesulfovibrio salexigens]ACS79059.1 periplasmic solute binding protein [Maridesulfovibrio salexigens DSM 2638]
MSHIKIILLTALLVISITTHAQAKKLIIGTTLHPYYSFVSNIVQDRAIVQSLIGDGFNPHNYRPQPEDIKRVMDLDVLVVNGIGHDEFAMEILEAAQMKGKIPVIYANKEVSLIPVAGNMDDLRIVNPHTFISVTTSIQQIYTITKALAEIDPDNADFYKKNGRKYVRKLRKLKAKYMQRIADLPDVEFRCATIHGGYDYLLQDFGLQVTAVIEPNHGLKPTANQLAKTIRKIKDLNVDVIFTEMHFPDKYVDTIHEETGIRIRHLSHLTGGSYTPEDFERGIEANMKALTDALIEALKIKDGK